MAFVQDVKRHWDIDEWSRELHTFFQLFPLILFPACGSGTHVHGSAIMASPQEHVKSVGVGEGEKLGLCRFKPLPSLRCRHLLPTSPVLFF